MKWFAKRLMVRFGRGRASFFEDALRRAEKQKRAFDRLSDDDPRKAQMASNLLHTLMQGVTTLAGEKVASLAYGPDLDLGSSRHSALFVIWHRLGLAQNVFGTYENESSPTSFSAMREEVLALMHGDEPKLFARLENAGTSGQWRVAYRVASAKLEILVWDRFVKDQTHVSLRLNEFRSWIGVGFDSSKRRDWEKVAEKHLGRENVMLAYCFAADRRFRLPTDYTVRDIKNAVGEAIARLRDAEAGK